MATPQLRNAAEEAFHARQDVRTRQILTAAAALMQQHGSHKVSMKAIADEAEVSVGLIYRYYDNKEDLVRAVIINVLDEMAYQIPKAMEPLADPVRRVAAAFTAYAEVVRDKRKAVLLTYRETGSLDREGQDLIKDLEIQTGQHMRQAVEAAIEAGYFRSTLPAATFSFDLIMIAHGWALKYWYFSARMSFEEYVATQVSMALHSALAPEHLDTYRDLLSDTARIATA